MKILRSLCLCLVLLAIGGAAPGIPADFYVSTAGNDAWSGTIAEPDADKTDGPFATITRARDAIRKLAEEKKLPVRPVRVQIRGGVYRITQPIRFGVQDSGRADEGPVVYSAYPGERPIFSGGRPIDGWKDAGGGVWKAEVADIKSGKWAPTQLFVRGKGSDSWQRRTRARTPDEGYFRNTGPVKPLGDRAKARSDKSTKMGFRFEGDNIKQWEDLEQANIVLFHSWTASRHFVASVDTKEKVVQFTAPSNWPIGYWQQNERYYVENVRDAFNAPGEWILDLKEGAVLYRPMPGEKLDEFEAVAPVVRELVVFSGDKDAGKHVEHIRLEGLSFRHSLWDLERDKSSDGQSAVGHVGAAVTGWWARYCDISDCEIAHVGEYGLWFRTGCRNNRFVGNFIHDMGAGGICVGDMGYPANEFNESGHTLIANNFVHNGGNVYREGVGLWIGQCGDNTIVHNEICHLFYSGMSIGWRWGYGQTATRRNRIEYNYIHDIGHRVLSDMGGIYTLGIQTGTTIRYNHIHDVYSNIYGGWGIYPDEGSSNLLIENNLVYRTKTGGFHQHYGRENVVRNNIFAFAEENQLQRTRPENHKSFNFERNIVVMKQGKLWHGNLNDNNARIDCNLYWHYGGKPIDFFGQTLAAWRNRGHDVHSTIANPDFVDPENGDFRLKPGSPALKLGFVPFDISSAGLEGRDDWTSLPKKVHGK